VDQITYSIQNFPRWPPLRFGPTRSRWTGSTEPENPISESNMKWNDRSRDIAIQNFINERSVGHQHIYLQLH